MNAPELPGAESARLPFVSVDARRATLSLLNAVGAFESDPKGNWNFVNPYLCDLLGVPSSSLLDREWIKMIHPDDVQRAVAEYKQARDGGRSWHHELRFRRYDGSVVPVLIDANPLPQDPDARGVSYLGIVSDVTRERRAQEIVEETRNAFVTMLEAVDEGIVIHRDGWIVLANDFAANLLGFDEATELLGMNGYARIAPDDVQRAQRIVRAGEQSDTILTFIRRDGSPVRISVRGKAVQYAGSPARATVMVPLDSPLLLNLTKERLQAQVDALLNRLTLPHSRIEFRDGKPVIVAANQAYADLMGRPMTEIIGIEVEVLSPREINQEAWDGFEERLRTGSRMPNFPITYRRPDGTLVPCTVYSVDYRDPVTGEPAAMSFIVRL